MLVLALDASLSACSAALWGDGVVLARRFVAMGRGQAEALMPMVAACMAEAGLGPGAIDLIAVTVGPGAFTGLRIGLAAARGLAVVTGRPVAGVTTTEAIAAAVPRWQWQGRRLLVAVDGKRADVFVQLFGPDGAPLTPPTTLLPADAPAFAAGPLLLAGDGAARLAPLLPAAAQADAAGVPDAARFAALAARRWREGTALPPQPLYLRPPDVTLPGGA